MIDYVLDIVNNSLETGIFPNAFKKAGVKPLLKKPNLDYSLLNNYRPISNISFLSKILEKIVLQQLNQFLDEYSIREKYQSGFRQGHNTETALLKIVNDLRLNTDKGNASVLILLDLSAAFDMVDHCILIDRLEKCIGLSGNDLNWFKTYITERTFSVNIGDCTSKNYDILYGVPQGSILGPVLFSLYMLPLGSIIQKYEMNYHLYADDIQLYISVKPRDTVVIESLSSCLSSIVKWMNVNFKKFNKDKTEILIVGKKNLSGRGVKQNCVP